MSTNNISRFFVYLLSASVLIAPSKYAEKCRQWALEDAIPSAQISAYVRECSAEQAEANSAPQSLPVEKDKQESERDKLPTPLLRFP